MFRYKSGFSLCVKSFCLVLALSVAFHCAGLGIPSKAYASVQKSDIVMGETLDSRGLKASLCPSVDANYVYLVDSEGTVYFERAADDSTQIASITKVMTAIVALEGAPLDTNITVSSLAARVGESSAGLIAGDELTLENALKGLMIPSGNDAAIAIGECLGKMFLQSAKNSQTPIYRLDGSEITGTTDSDCMDAFVAAMNAKASELGCTNTVFTNPHGLDFGEFSAELHSCAKEVAKIADYAMKNDYFKEIVDLPSAQLPIKRNGIDATITVETTDELLGRYDGACGIKTGNTSLAGPCFAGACERDGLMLYAIVLDSTSEAQRFNDAETLYNWVWDNYIDYKLADSDVYTSMDVNGSARDVPVVAEVSLTSWLDKTVPATLADPDKTVNVFRMRGNVSQEVTFDDVSGSVEAGQVVGKVDYYQKNELIASEDLVACESVPGPNLFEMVSIGWDRFWRGFGGEPTEAESVVVAEPDLLIDKN